MPRGPHSSTHWTNLDHDLAVWLYADLGLPAWAVGRLLYRSADSVRLHLWQSEHIRTRKDPEPLWNPRAHRQWEVEYQYRHFGITNPFFGKDT